MYSSLILLPFAGLVVLNLLYKTAFRKAALGIGAGCALYQIILSVGPAGIFSASPDFIGSFFNFNLQVDNLSRVVLCCIGIVFLAALWVGRSLVREAAQWFNFICLMLVSLAGLNGIAMVADIFSLYIFLEITAVASFILIAFDKDIAGLEGAFKYLVLSAVATALMLAAIGLLLVVSGSTDFAVLAQTLQGSAQAPFVRLAVALFLCGLFIKAGLMPFHGWLPDAYASAPAAVSVLLAGIVTKTVGVYTLIRVVNSVFGMDEPLKLLLMAVGTFSIVLGALAAIGQRDFKRMLAYSSISQVGYIILGFGSGTALGFAGAVFHLFNHAIFKSLLFVNACAVETRTGTRDMDKLSGLAAGMPLTGATSVIASLSAAGVPPLAGFWSKLIIIIALWTAGHYGYAVIAVLASLITLTYFLSMQRRVFFGLPAAGAAGITEAPLGITLTSVLLAALIVAAGLFFPYFMNIFNLPVGPALGGSAN